MAAITADSNMQSVLSQVKETTEIRDANGNLMGIYTPQFKTDEDIKRYFDLNEAHEKLATETARPFREMIQNLDKIADRQG